jgi:hypothetical protein
MISIMFDVQQGNFSIYLISLGVADLKKYRCSTELSPYLSSFCTTLMSYFSTIEGDGTSLLLGGYRREMGWVLRGRWVVKLGRWVAKLVSRLLATAALCMGSNPDISQKYKINDLSKGLANTL